MCTCVYRCPQSSNEFIRFPTAGATDNDNESSMAPETKFQSFAVDMLLTAKPSLKPYTLTS